MAISNKSLRSLLYAAVYLAASAAVTSCSNDLLDESGHGNKTYGLITISVSVPVSETASRANPAGGEDGNGREQGILNENNIHDLNIFFYEGSGLNPVNPEDINVINCYLPQIDEDNIKFENLPFEKKYTCEIPIDESGLQGTPLLDAGKTVSFVTVLNAGKALSDVKTLKELREYIVDSSTTNPEGNLYAANYDNFVMTTAYDASASGEIVVDNNVRKVGDAILKYYLVNGESNYRGETTVQRLCGRVDIMYQPENYRDYELFYTVAASGAKVHITHLSPVNFMSKPSYLITKMTNRIPTVWTETGLGTIVWGGIEKTIGAAKVPDNYVIEPTTIIKTGNPGSLPNTCYGNTSTTAVKNNLANPSTVAKFSVGNYYTGEIDADANMNFARTLIVGYPNENVQNPANSDSRYITGVAFRALFQPGSLSSYTGGVLQSVPLSDAGWEAMADKSYTRYVIMNQDGLTDGQAIYFVDDAQARAYSAAHPEHQAELTRFTNGVCYYNLWLRHYNDVNDATPSNPHEKLPMEYVTVRNNIYRVSLGFSGPGEPTPELREPDTMQARIFVRKWNKRVENAPIEF